MWAAARRVSWVGVASLLGAGAGEPPAKVVPGGPGVDGSGGDQPVNRVEPPAGEVPAVKAPEGVVVKADAAAVPFPHPIITEVLFAVPSGAAGDANKDGVRDAAGDEFIELINPHDQPIQLFGYTLTDSQEPSKGQMKFAFPALELAPGAVVVVFNGFGAKIADPVGDNRTPPRSVSDAFGGAWVFSMRCASNKTALGNAGDHVMLAAPDGTRVQRVWWSEEPARREAEEQAGKEQASGGGAAEGGKVNKPPLVEDFAPTGSRGSVTRDGVLGERGRFTSTMEVERVALSPGVYVGVVRPGK